MYLRKLILGLCSTVVATGPALGEGGRNATLPELKQRGVVKILSEDGGGQRGEIEAIINDYLAYYVGKPPQMCVDYLAGTSTGGLNALLLALGVPTHKILELYEDRGGEIFKKGWKRKLRSLFGLTDEKYDRDGLDAITWESAGQTRLSDIDSTRVILTGFDTLENAPIIFSSVDAKKSVVNDWYAGDAARGTSAAPTYFELVQIYNMQAHQNREAGMDLHSDGGREAVVMDGGMVANNPAGIAVAEAQKEFPGTKPYVVSIGTGVKKESVPFSRVKNASLPYWAVNAPKILMRAASSIVHQNLNRGLGDEHYWRLQTKLEHASDAMDDYSARQIGNLRKDTLTTIARFAAAEVPEDLYAQTGVEARFNAREIMYKQGSAVGKIVELWKDRAPVAETGIHIDTSVSSSSSSSSTASTEYVSSGSASGYSTYVDDDVMRAIVGFRFDDESDDE